jgi:hypothetical protein
MTGIIFYPFKLNISPRSESPHACFSRWFPLIPNRSRTVRQTLRSPNIYKGKLCDPSIRYPLHLITCDILLPLTRVTPNIPTGFGRLAIVKVILYISMASSSVSLPCSSMLLGLYFRGLSVLSPDRSQLLSSHADGRMNSASQRSPLRKFGITQLFWLLSG